MRKENLDPTSTATKAAVFEFKSRYSHLLGLYRLHLVHYFLQLLNLIMYKLAMALEKNGLSEIV